MKFVAFQNAEFVLGSLWRNFCHQDDVRQQGPRGQNDRKDSHYNLEDTGLGGEGGAIEGTTNKAFGAIPYFLVIADYEKAFLYVALG